MPLNPLYSIAAPEAVMWLDGRVAERDLRLELRHALLQQRPNHPHRNIVDPFAVGRCGDAAVDGDQAGASGSALPSQTFGRSGSGCFQFKCPVKMFMPLPRISRHSENLHPEVVRFLQTPDGIKSVDTFIGDNNGHIYDISKPASRHPEASGMITEVFPHAISYSTIGTVTNMAGAVLTSVTISSSLLWSMVYVSRSDFHSDMLQYRIGFYFVFLIALLFSVVGGLWAAHMEMFRPANEPLVFDRKRRKVIAVARDTKLSLSSFIRPSGWRINEYDWDLITAARITKKEFTGATVRLAHDLLLTVQYSHDNRAMIDGLGIGASMLYVTSQRVDNHWEHLRRYMEENGPPLPHNSLPSTIPPVKTLWQRLLWLTPFNAEYRLRWRTKPVLSFVCHLFAPPVRPLAAHGLAG
ncbi:DUF6708 domain-containing protein [Chitinibacteraceae bacterium HSL-7]